MPDPKTGALPLGDAPNLTISRATKHLAWLHRPRMSFPPDCRTRKEAPTGFHLYGLNGALLRFLIVKNPKNACPASRQQCVPGARLYQRSLRPFDLRVGTKYHRL